MSELDIDASLAFNPNTTKHEFTFKPSKPTSATAQYLNTANGTIEVPRGSGSLTIHFHLATGAVHLPDSPGQVPIRFDLGLGANPLHARKVLKIWQGSDKNTAAWPQDFSKVERSSDGMTVSVHDANKVAGQYFYRLAVGAHVPGSIKVIEVDPIIKNGGSRANFLPPYVYYAIGTVIALLVAGVAMELVRRKRLRR